MKFRTIILFLNKLDRLGKENLKVKDVGIVNDHKVNKNKTSEDGN